MTTPYTPPITGARIADIRAAADRLADDRAAWGHATPDDVDHLRRNIRELADALAAIDAEHRARLTASATHVPPWVRHTARVRIEAADGTVLDVDGDEFRDYWHNGTVNEALAEAGGWPDLDPPATS